MNDDDLRLAEDLLQNLKKKTDEIDQQMDDMVSAMENTPPEKRDGKEWHSFTTRFLELQAAQRSVGEKLRRARLALADPEVIRAYLGEEHA